MAASQGPSIRGSEIWRKIFTVVCPFSTTKSASIEMDGQALWVLWKNCLCRKDFKARPDFTGIRAPPYDSTANRPAAGW